MDLYGTFYFVSAAISTMKRPKYYSTNTFLLGLTEPAYTPITFVNGPNGELKYVRRVQSLQSVIGDAVSQNDDPLALSDYAREATQDHEGLWLKKLIILEFCQTFISKKLTPKAIKKRLKPRSIPPAA